jgi:hypothetical protein
MTNNVSNTALISNATAIEVVKYTDTVRTPQLKRDTFYAMKEWLEQVKGAKGAVVSNKFRITKVKFLGASWNGEGMWLKDGELPMLKASEGLNYFFTRGEDTLKARVTDRCLFLNAQRVTFSKLAEAPEGADATLLDVTVPEATVEEPAEELPEENEVFPMDMEEMTEALLELHAPRELMTNPLDGELLELEPEVTAPVKAKRVRK